MGVQTAIVILNWNGKVDTLECLESLQFLDYQEYEIIIVDNGSSDDSIQRIGQLFPMVTLIALPENLGFAEGNNRGIQYALETHCDYILLLNNDTIVDPAFLKHLVAAAENDPEIGMLNPMIYRYGNDEIWFGGGTINWKNGITNHVTKLSQISLSSASWNALPSDYVTGCALLVRREVIERIGGFDPRFFAYYEDTDWSVRCRKAGWKIGIVPSARIRHKVSASASPRSAYTWGHRNMILFLWKHSSLWRFPCRFRRAVYKCLHEFAWNRERTLGEAAMHGLWSALTLKFGEDTREMPPWLLRFIKKHLRYFLTIFGYRIERKKKSGLCE